MTMAVRPSWWSPPPLCCPTGRGSSTPGATSGAMKVTGQLTHACNCTEYTGMHWLTFCGECRMHAAGRCSALGAARQRVAGSNIHSDVIHGCIWLVHSFQCRVVLCHSGQRDSAVAAVLHGQKEVMIIRCEARGILPCRQAWMRQPHMRASELRHSAAAAAEKERQQLVQRERGSSRLKRPSLSASVQLRHSQRSWLQRFAAAKRERPQRIRFPGCFQPFLCSYDTMRTMEEQVLTVPWHVSLLCLFAHVSFCLPAYSVRALARELPFLWTCGFTILLSFGRLPAVA